MRKPEGSPAPLSENRFPGYDVLSKRSTLSWNDKTREVVARRLSIAGQPKFFTGHEFNTVTAIAERIVPQPATRPPIPVTSLIDEKLHQGTSDGYRQPGMPREGAAWRQGLRALDVESMAAFANRFDQLATADQDALLLRMQKGDLKDPAWEKMPPAVFFKARMAHDIVHAYYAHPTAWSEIGWGGPASPRGYVRLDFDERDSWEAAEVKDGDVEAARRKNHRVG